MLLLYGGDDVNATINATRVRANGGAPGTPGTAGTAFSADGGNSGTATGGENGFALAIKVA